MNVSDRWICTIRNDENAEEMIKQIKSMYGYVLLRGRHSNRSQVLKDNGLKPNMCGDIPWKLSETIAIYRRK